MSAPIPTLPIDFPVQSYEDERDELKSDVASGRWHEHEGDEDPDAFEPEDETDEEWEERSKGPARGKKRTS